MYPHYKLLHFAIAINFGALDNKIGDRFPVNLAIIIKHTNSTLYHVVSSEIKISNMLVRYLEITMRIIISGMSSR